MDKPTPLDQTIADIAAGETDDQTLERFERLASEDSVAWQRLALMLRDELAMRSGLDRQLNSEHQLADAEISRARTTPSTKPPALRWLTWSGWAVAASLLLVFQMNITVHQPAEMTPNGASLAAFTAQEALDRYITRGTEEGRVIAELPTVMVEARELEQGVLEVLYLRQFLERERVNEVYTVASDELGMPQPVKVDFAGWDFSDLSDSSL